MLGKIIKHDLIATSRYFIPTFLVFFIISIINKIMFELGMVSTMSNQFLEISSVIFLTIYGLSVISAYILVYVFITMHFYKTMSGEQGYLTHTLPVKTTTIINGKLLCGVIWQIAAGILIFASVGLLAVGHVDSIDLNRFIMDMMEAVSALSGSSATFWIIMSIAVIVSLFSGPLMFYVSIALGHLFKKQKIAGAVLAYIVIYVIMQVCSTILVMVTGYWSLANNSGTLDYYHAFNSLMIYSNLLCVAFGIAFYIITCYIFSRKLNLE